MNYAYYLGVIILFNDGPGIVKLAPNVEGLNTASTYLGVLYIKFINLINAYMFYYK